MTAAFVGPTDLIVSALAPSKYDEHMKAWRWHCFRTGNFHYWPKYSNRIVYGAREVDQCG